MTVSTTPTKRLVSVKMSQRLNKELQRIAGIEGLTLSSVMQWLLEILLPIAQAEPRYRLVPRRFDPDPLVNEVLKVRLEQRRHEFLVVYAYEQNQSISNTACQLLWLGVEFHQQLVQSHLLRKEEFANRIQQELALRWSKVQ